MIDNLPENSSEINFQRINPLQPNLDINQTSSPLNYDEIDDEDEMIFFDNDFIEGYDNDMRYNESSSEDDETVEEILSFEKY